VRRRNWRRSLGVLTSYLVMVFLLITLNFFLPRAMPGDPLDSLLSQASPNFTFGEQNISALRDYYELDGSLVSQYVHYLDRLAHGDLGRSIITLTPVTEEIGRRLPWTALLVTSSILLSTLLGTWAGVRSAWRRDKATDRAMMTGLITVWQFPPYLLGTILLFLFAVQLGWFPLFGGQTPFSDAWSPLARVLDVAWHLALPLVVLIASLAAWNYLLMRSSMISELGSDYLLLGRAKGLRPRRLKYNYAARNAILPLVSSIALDIGVAVFADVVVEQVFSYPGLGALMFESIGTRDYPTIQGVFLTLSLLVVTVNALADVLYRRLDPRVSA
jgi:peptide/nickel transport system permease protein